MLKALFACRRCDIEGIVWRQNDCCLIVCPRCNQRCREVKKLKKWYS